MSSQNSLFGKQRDIVTLMEKKANKDTGFIVIDLTDDNEESETISFLEEPGLAARNLELTTLAVGTDNGNHSRGMFDSNGIREVSRGVMQSTRVPTKENGASDTSVPKGGISDDLSPVRFKSSSEYNPASRLGSLSASPLMANGSMGNSPQNIIGKSGAIGGNIANLKFGNLLTSSNDDVNIDIDDEEDDDDVIMLNEVRLTPAVQLPTTHLVNPSSSFPLYNQPVPLPLSIQHGNPAVYHPFLQNISSSHKGSMNASLSHTLGSRQSPSLTSPLNILEASKTSEDLYIANEMRKLVDNISNKINSTSLMIESYNRHIKNDKERLKRTNEEINRLEYRLELNLDPLSTAKVLRLLLAKKANIQTLTDDINVWKETAEKCAADLKQFKTHKELMLSHPEAFITVLKKKRQQQLSTSNIEINRQQHALFGRQLARPLQQAGEVERVFSQEDSDISKLIENILPDNDLFDSDSLLPEPKGLTIKLLKHQRIGVDWIYKMEKGSNKGGILADDMGLGKTVQALAALLANPSLDKRVQTTLIVGPVALLRQWQAEIRQKIDESHKQSTFLYHSSEKAESFKQLAKFDIVLTSYGTLSSEFKKHFKEYYDTPENKGTVPLYGDGGISYLSPFYSKDTMFHRIILDEAHVIKNKKTLASKACASVAATYRLCLTGTPIQNNVEELYSLVRFLRIKPHNKEEVFRKLIILPLKDSSKNYDKLEKSSAMRRLQILLKAILLRRTKSSKIDGKPILELTKRVIEKNIMNIYGDEGQFYKSLSKAVQQEARKLLGSEKLGDYSNVLTLLLRLRQACCHSFLVRIGDRVKEVTEKENNDSLYDLGMRFNDDDNTDNESNSPIKQLKSMIRNCKNFTDGTISAINSQYASDASYCPMCSDLLVFDTSCILNPCGHALCIDCVESFFENCAIGDEEDRAACTQCSKVVERSKIVHYKVFNEVCNMQKSEAQTINQFTNNDTKKQLIVDENGYQLLKDFYSNIRVNGPMNLRQSVLLEFLKSDPNALQTSPKMNQCLNIINDIFTNLTDDKIIIFSQFTLFFDLFGKILNDKGIQHLRYDGSMTMDERNICIENFYENPLKRVMLISLKAGNFGLTLTCASHVVIVDPFWNPFVEEQAMDRAHRIGQLKDVHVHRLLSEDTVEERIMDLQEQKRDLVNKALNEAEFKNISRLGRKELGFLFGINGR